MRARLNTFLIFSLLLTSFLAPISKSYSCRLDVFASRAELARTKTEQISKISNLLEENRLEFIHILSQVDNINGANYEFNQALETLRGVEEKELDNILRSRTLENVAVYGSTNIPLYTLIMHAFIPALTAKNIWFRTPLSTREVYRQLFGKIRELSNDPVLNRFLDRVHILHEARDVQYDQFRKKYVLGLNNKGKRFVRPPAEIALFTGSPETGRRIFQQNVEKVQRLKERNPDLEFKQVFLMFGSGLNPTVLMDSRPQYMDQFVDAAFEALSINNGQDCMAPKFYAVHEDQVETFRSRLQERISHMRFGETQDPQADYTPLTFSENVDSLQEYRNRFQQYLKNPSAQIQSDSQRVDPHLFVFPSEMFGPDKVPLVDHFAPFVVVFSYQNMAQLRAMLSDPRLEQKAMFASLYGEIDTPSFQNISQLLEHSRHMVIHNQSVFNVEDGNSPFGGYGPDASSVLVMESTSEQLSVDRSSRPLLFSQEAARYFPR